MVKYYLSNGGVNDGHLMKKIPVVVILTPDNELLAVSMVVSTWTTIRLQHEWLSQF